MVQLFQNGGSVTPVYDDEIFYVPAIPLADNGRKTIFMDDHNR